jgi:hypothetical protein
VKKLLYPSNRGLGGPWNRTGGDVVLTLVEINFFLPVWIKHVPG